MSTRPVLLSVLAAAACHSAARQPALLPSVAAARRDIIVRVQATGTLEPIDLVAIRSKASGVVRKMPVDIGSLISRRRRRPASPEAALSTTGTGAPGAGSPTW